MAQAPQKKTICSMEGMGTRALGMCLAEKTLRDRMRGEGEDKDRKEACVEVPTNWKKRETRTQGAICFSWLCFEQRGIGLDNLQRHLPTAVIL